MAQNNSCSEKLYELLDKIFLLNHKIVNQMVKSYEEEKKTNVKISPDFSQKIEEMAFDKLSNYYKKLRELLIEALEVENELIISSKFDIETDEAVSKEANVRAQKEAEDFIIENLKSRIEDLFVSMDLIKKAVYYENEEEPELFESVYYGSLEENIRKLEYKKLVESIEIQFSIIEFEDYLKKNTNGVNITIPPLVTPMIIDAIANQKKYETAEKHCRKFVKDSMKQKEIFDEFPELKDTMEEVAYLEMEERYNYGFEKAAGFLNTEAGYTDLILYLYKKNLLHNYTNFEEDEIFSRIASRINSYSEDNKQKINDIFNNNVRKYRMIIRKRNISDIADLIRTKISGFSTLPKRYFRRIKKFKESRKKKSNNQDKQPITIASREKNGEDR